MTHIFPRPTNEQRNNGWQIEPGYLKNVVKSLRKYIEENHHDLTAEDIEEILTHAEIVLSIWEKQG